MTLFLVNLVLAGLWVFLWGSLNFYTLLVGLVLGYLAIALFTRATARGRAARAEYVGRISNALSFAWYFAKALVRSNLEIAKEILSPGLGITPRIVRYDVTGLGDGQIVTLASAITLTPGTLVVDSITDADGRRTLYIHTMYAQDRDAAVAEIDALRDRMEEQLFRRPAGAVLAAEATAPREVVA
jgi:multicomponent Na+:H+ antiporter subunit E